MEAKCVDVREGRTIYSSGRESGQIETGSSQGEPAGEGMMGRK